MCTHSATNGYDPMPARVITLNEQAAGPTVIEQASGESLTLPIA